MDNFSLASSITHYCYTFSGKPYCVPTTTLPFYPITACSHDSDTPTTATSSCIRPTINNKLLKPITNSPSNPQSPKPKPKPNPLRTLLNPTPERNPIGNKSQTLTEKLWLTSRLSPLPPAPPQPQPDLDETENKILISSSNSGSKQIEYIEKGKIFVGNLPLWIKKNELTEFFRQFGPIKNVILIKGYNETERNMGFGFVIYGGVTAEKSAMKAVEFDGMEFLGRVLTVKLDDGRRMKEKSVGRARWIEGDDDKDYKSKWQEEREGSRSELKRVIESQPENWQAVITTFQRIPKVIALILSVCVCFHTLLGSFKGVV